MCIINKIGQQKQRIAPLLFFIHSQISHINYCGVYMEILSVKLKSVIITMAVILLVVFGIFMTAHTLSDTVSGEARMIPIYNVDTDENKVAITFNCAVGNSDIDSILATLDKYDGS